MQGKLFSMEMEMNSSIEAADNVREELEKMKAEYRMTRSELERSIGRESQLKKEHSQQSMGWTTRWERERKDLQERSDQMVAVSSGGCVGGVWVVPGLVSVVLDLKH